jgi:hypothetical protein
VALALFFFEDLVTQCASLVIHFLCQYGERVKLFIMVALLVAQVVAEDAEDSSTAEEEIKKLGEEKPDFHTSLVRLLGLSRKQSQS